MNNIQFSLIDAENEIDDFLSNIDSLHLTERIQISSNGSASVVVDGNVKMLALDAKKTIIGIKTLYQKLLDTKRKIPTNSYLKFFRLFSSNARKLVDTLKQKLSDTSWLTEIPIDITKKGIKTIETFRQAINKTLDEINERIYDKNYKISVIPKIQWKFIKVSKEDLEKKRREIKLRDWKPISEF